MAADENESDEQGDGPVNSKSVGESRKVKIHLSFHYDGEAAELARALKAEQDKQIKLTPTAQTNTHRH